jgi:hypothetical protein
MAASIASDEKKPANSICCASLFVAVENGLLQNSHIWKRKDSAGKKKKYYCFKSAIDRMCGVVGGVATKLCCCCSTAETKRSDLSVGHALFLNVTSKIFSWAKGKSFPLKVWNKNNSLHGHFTEIVPTECR